MSFHTPIVHLTKLPPGRPRLRVMVSVPRLGRLVHEAAAFTLAAQLAGYARTEGWAWHLDVGSDDDVSWIDLELSDRADAARAEAGIVRACTALHYNQAGWL